MRKEVLFTEGEYSIARYDGIPEHALTFWKRISWGNEGAVYQNMKVGEIDEKTLTKMSWLTALICYHHDMLELIGQLKLLPFIIKLVENKYSVAIRSNAVLGI
jgi:hypothetical protein